jgi:cellulose synthase/poly-beta-1,6-N-acetylglucosamine synthase-like glycosyltransferase
MALAIVSVVLTFLCVLLLAPTLVLFVEVVAAVLPGGFPATPRGQRPRRVAVLIPAHDEETSIPRTLRSITPQLGPEDRLVVVADNCSDRTGDVARSEGAQVLTRKSLELRGKGYALDHGVRHLEQDAPDVVIIIDADCIVESGSIAILAAAAAGSGRPIQALYRMTAPEGAGLRQRIAEFAWLIKNQVRPLGLHRMGLPCQLMGTGMAFPWPVIRTAPLATGHIVEDLKLGLDLARRGSPPLFCTGAAVSSEFPSSNEGVRSQRTRWEHGHLRSILDDAPKLLLQSALRANAALASMALDLSVPPLALLAMLIAAGWPICLSLMLATRTSAPFLMVATSTLLFGSAVILCWQRFGRRTISGRDLALASIYAICKVPLYFRFLLKPQSKWVRSKRG